MKSRLLPHAVRAGVVLASAFVCAAPSWSAITQPLTTPVTSVLTANPAMIESGYTFTATGNATFTGPALSLTDTVATIPADLSPLSVAFNAADGFSVTGAGLPLVGFNALSYDVGTQLLSGQFYLGLPTSVLYTGALLQAGSTVGDIGGSPLTAVSNSSTPRSLSLLATGFGIAPAFLTYLQNTFGTAFNPQLVSGAVTSLSVTAPPVPEPATYALAAAGLMIVGALSRRKHQG